MNYLTVLIPFIEPATGRDRASTADGLTFLLRLSTKSFKAISKGLAMKIDE
jgi:hypothetical protein